MENTTLQEHQVHASASSVSPRGSVPKDYDVEICEKKGSDSSTCSLQADSTRNNEHSSSARSWKRLLLRSKIATSLASAITGDKSGSLDESGQLSEKSRPWKTTFLRFGPLSGLFCLALALASLVASLGILAGSDRQAVDNWSITPSTYIAIFTAIGNLSVRYAAIQGVVIGWWYRASKGSTLARLNWDWRAGMTIRGAVSAGRNLGLLGLACIFSTIVVIDGPLLQRSTTVVAAEFSVPVNLDVTMAPEIPHLFTGWRGPVAGLLASNAFNATIPTPFGNASDYNSVGYNWDMLAVSNAWSQGVPIDGLVKGCPGNCKVTLKAPALFPAACKSWDVTSDFEAHLDIPAIFKSAYRPPLENDLLIIDLTLIEEETESMDLITGHWTGHDCKGTLHMTTCALKSGIGEYQVLVKDNETSVDPKSALQPELVAIANNTAVDHDSKLSTLGGIVSLISEWYGSVNFATATKDGLQSANIGPPTQWNWAVPNTDNSGATCPSFNSPQDDILRKINLLAVYTGALAGNKLTEQEAREKMDDSLEVNTTIIGDHHGQHNVFHTNYWFFLGAAIVEIICVLLVSPTYWGWWQFGRPTSLSPLEMAKAFESPLLAEYDSNSSGRDLTASLTEKRVRYGATASALEAGGEKLAFADPALVEKPQRGTHYRSH